MPLYEYVCRKCTRRFEALVMGSVAPACPACRSGDLDKLFSTFAVRNGESGSAREAENPADTGAPCGSCGDPRGPGSCAVD